LVYKRSVVDGPVSRVAPGPELADPTPMGGQGCDGQTPVVRFGDRVDPHHHPACASARHRRVHIADQ